MHSECQPWHRADADAAKAEAQWCGTAVRLMTAERERLQQQVRVQCQVVSHVPLALLC
jgi:hypothetical protein